MTDKACDKLLKKYKCPACDRGFKTKAGASIHAKVIHSLGPVDSRLSERNLIDTRKEAEEVVGKTIACLATIVGLLVMANVSLMGKTMEQELAEPIVTWAKTDNANGKCLTPFQQTVGNIKAFLFANNTHAFTMKDIVAGIEHHYKTDASARNSLRIWIDAGLVQGIFSTVGVPNKTTRYYLDWVKRSANLPGANNGR